MASCERVVTTWWTQWSVVSSTLGHNIYWVSTYIALGCCTTWTIINYMTFEVVDKSRYTVSFSFLMISPGNLRSNFGIKCLSTFCAPVVRVGNICKLFRFLVSISCISLLKVNILRKKFDNESFVNLYQNFIHYINYSIYFYHFHFYLAALKGSGVLSSPERAGGRADKPR